jgi:hypothetical protein
MRRSLEAVRRASHTGIMRWAKLTPPKRYWRTLTAICIGLLAMTAAIVAFWPVPLEERVSRIQPGMTEVEVEEVMGLPPGNYSDYAEVRRGGVDSTESRVRRWIWNDATVKVWFDVDGHVIRTEYTSRPLSLSERLHLWVDY